MVSYIKGTSETVGTIKQRTEDDVCAVKRRMEY
jgi:hypothetical protein